MLSRNNPLRRAGAILRRTPLRAVNRERRAKRFERDFGPKADWIRQQPCCVCQRIGTMPPVQAHHVQTRARGGTAADLVPLCGPCHRELHLIGRITFARNRKVSLADMRDSYEALWQCLQRNGAS